MEQEKVYILLRQDWEETWIQGAFTTREKAEIIKQHLETKQEKHKKQYDYEIEEVVLE